MSIRSFYSIRTMDSNTETKTPKRGIMRTKMLALEQGRKRCDHCDINPRDYECMEKGCPKKNVCKKCESIHPSDHTLMT